MNPIVAVGMLVALVIGIALLVYLDKHDAKREPPADPAAERRARRDRILAAVDGIYHSLGEQVTLEGRRGTAQVRSLTGEFTAQLDYRASEAAEGVRGEIESALAEHLAGLGFFDQFGSKAIETFLRETATPRIVTVYREFLGAEAERHDAQLRAAAGRAVGRLLHVGKREAHLNVEQNFFAPAAAGAGAGAAAAGGLAALGLGLAPVALVGAVAAVLVFGILFFKSEDEIRREALTRSRELIDAIFTGEGYTDAARGIRIPSAVRELAAFAARAREAYVRRIEELRDDALARLETNYLALRDAAQRSEADLDRFADPDRVRAFLLTQPVEIDHAHQAA